VDVFSDDGYGKIFRLLNSLYLNNAILNADINYPISTVNEYNSYITKTVGWNAPEGHIVKEDKQFIFSHLMGLGIRSDSLMINEALDLINLVHINPELVNFLIYGEKDVDYILIDGYPYTPDNNPIMSYINELGLGFGLFNGLIPSQMNNRWVEIRPQHMTPSPHVYMELNTHPSPFIGFYPDTSGYEQTINALERIIATNITNTIWLSNDLEITLNNINQQMINVGLDEWLNEVNRQLDDFFSR